MFTELRAMLTNVVVGHYINMANFFIAGFSMAIIYGLVLGLLYRKPTETPTVKETIMPEEKAERCQHCGASIPKGSLFCNICGRKQ